MWLHFGQAVARKPTKQTDKMFTTIFTLDPGNALSVFGRHDARKFQLDLASAEKLNHLVLQIEELKRLFGVGNLEHKLFANTFARDKKVLIAFAWERRG